jgi:putative aldouronate transport system permease protein
MRETFEDRIFSAVNYVLLSIALIMILYPLYFIIIASISDPNTVNAGEVWLWPKGLTLKGYMKIFENQSIWVGYRNTIIYTCLGTIINVVLTLTSAYALSRKDLLGRNLLMLVLTFTMFFSGGLIPTYLLIMRLGMLDTIWAMLIPTAVGVWNVIVARTYFQSNIPTELLEAAQMDGCSNLRFLRKIVLPLSNAIIAVMILFYSVNHWNSYFQALIYLNRQEMLPLQIILRNILVQNQAEQILLLDYTGKTDEATNLAEQIKYGIIVIASVPVLLLYPLLQRYFVQGIMIGSIKS